MQKLVVVLLFALACLPGAHAQAIAGYGAVTGMVLDPYGDGLPDTTVLIYNQALGVHRTIITTDDGVFDGPALIPGRGYGMKVSRKGYEAWEMKEFQVVVGQTINFTVQLQIEGGNYKIGQNNGPSPMDETKSGISGVVTAEEIAALPIAGRSLDVLAAVVPTATAGLGSGTVAFQGEGMTLSLLTNGGQTAFSYKLNRPDATALLTPDAVSQMQIVALAAPADFGRSSGGMLNVTTHTGTKNLHGTLYDYYNGAAWNARDRFAPSFDPNDKRNLVGGSLGGPVLPGHRIFWFANIQETNGSSNALNRITNPMLANTTGTAITSANCSTTATLCDAAVAFLNKQMNVVVPRSQRALNGFFRVDYQRDDEDRFFLEGNAVHRNAPDGIVNSTVPADGGLLGMNGNLGEEARYAKIGWWRSLKPTWFNDLHLDWYRDRISEYTDTKLLPSTGLLGLTIAGTQVGANPAFPMVVSEQRRQFSDNLTMTNLSHTLKFGVFYSKNRDWLFQNANGYGTYNFATLTAFANDFSGNTKSLKDYALFTQSFGRNQTYVATSEMGFYAQDTWKLTSALNVVAGVRYERMHTHRPGPYNSSYYQTCCVPLLNTEFAPRVGISFAVSERTVIRAGMGFYYQPYSGDLLAALFDQDAVNQTSIAIIPTQTSAPVYPNLIAGYSGIPSNTKNVLYASDKFRNPMAQDYTLAYDHRYGKNTVLTISALENHGTKLWSATDVNLSSSTISKNYLVYNSSGTQSGVFTTQIWHARNGAYAHIWDVENLGSSRYPAVTVQIRQQVRPAFLVQMSYTFSHALDDVSGPPVVGAVPSNTYPANYMEDKGNSLFDQRHRGTVTWVWQPKLVGGDSPLRWVLNGWSASTITTVASSMHQTPTALVNGQQFNPTSTSSTSFMTYTTSLNGTGGWDRVPFLGVGSMRLGMQYTVDARLSREFPFGERVKALLLVEAFNAGNMQYNTSVNTLSYVASGAVLRPVTGAGNGNAADGYPFGYNARHVQAGLRVTF